MVEPTGDIQELAPEAIFFSATDERGVIRLVNDVFVDRCRYSRDELVDSPHNIIRHPMMPGGLFHVMWNDIRAGEPFATYFHNLAADGSRYDVFATVVPLSSGGYLSVRTRPCARELMALVDTFYEAALELEHHLRHEGMSAADAAARGAELMKGLVADSELGGFTRVTHALLVREIAQRDEVVDVPTRPGAEGTLGSLLDELTRLYAMLDHWMARLAQLEDLARHLQDAGTELSTQVDDTSATVRMIAGLPAVSEDAAWVLGSLRRFSRHCGEISASLWELAQELKGVIASAEETAFPIALARLQTDLCVNYVVELIDRGPLQAAHDDDRRRALAMLCCALQDGIHNLERCVQAHTAALEQAHRDLDHTTELLVEHERLLADWRDLASTSSIPDSMAHLMPTLLEHQERTRQAQDRLGDLARHCFDGSIVEDLDELRGQVRAVLAVHARLDRD